MTIMTFKVFSPDDGFTTSIGTLTEAWDKEVRGEYNWTGEGKFTINRHDAAAAWFPDEAFRDGNNRLVRCYLDDDTDPFFAFWVETGKIVAVSTEEEGGETMELEGRGILACLDQFCLQNQIYAAGDVDGPLDEIVQTGEWHWTRDSISILTRFMEEGQAFGCFPEVTYTFDRDVDSNGDPHTADPDPPEVRYPVGTDGLQLISLMQKTNLFVAMDPDFTLRAYDVEQGNTVGFTFEYADNIRQSAEKDFDEAVGAYASHVLVEGDNSGGARVYRLREAGAHDRTVVRYLNVNETPSPSMLDRAGDRELAQRAKLAAGPPSIGVLIKEDQVPFVDYFPGDTATIDVPDVFDELSAQITAVILTETVSDNGEIDAIIEFDGPLARATTPRPPNNAVSDDCGCVDLPPFDCTPNDLEVLPNSGGDVLACIFSGHGNGQGCQSTNATTLYEGATYRIDYLVFHAAGSNGLTASLYQVGGSFLGSAPSPPDSPGMGNAPLVYMGDLNRGCSFDPPNNIPAASTEWTVVGFGVDGVDTLDVFAALQEGGCVSGTDSFSSSVSARIFYVSGPDPRFTGGGTPCEEGSPEGGQTVRQTFTGDGSSTSYTTVAGIPYSPGSLNVEVGGLDWTLAVTESDPTAGTYELAYAPPMGATVRVRFAA